MVLQKQFIFTLLFLSAGFFFLLSGCEAKKPAAPLEKITVAIYPSPHTTLVQVAQAKGFFQAEGLEVALQPQGSGKAAVQTLVDGKSDIATSADTPIMFALMRGASISVFATIRTASQAEAIVARSDMGIKTVADLAGKRVGVTRGTAADFFLASFLLVHGIQTSNVEIIDLAPEAIPDALMGGKVAAVATWIPITTRLQKDLGDRGITFHDENIYTETFNLAASRELIRQRPQVISRLLRALVKAEEYVARHPQESRQIVADFSHLDVAPLAEMWDKFHFVVSLNQSLLVTLEDQARWAIKNGLADRRDLPNFLEALYIDGLKLVKPDAVRIIR